MTPLATSLPASHMLTKVPAAITPCCAALSA
eukprot:CAMPEP_0206283748 /NCGR_PEP_ID=MMETSP0047_2-20121206/40395_1 /ASSEMBLY_ACC=CAM_ASM_000192 /TAXON_ID=195065 /ORGANISM="Chroomonas mesostigmatica_cf, Strain CCMP1168" /LENGTH=30 /DNA_ID= /DNA_START= /DNA_END= /DNA_ORIENTATION=